MNNDFKNVFDDDLTKINHSNGFKNRIMVPFISGILGCSLVIGTCFGVPSIKQKILGNSNSTSASSSVSSIPASSLTDTNARNSRFCFISFIFRYSSICCK